MEFDFKLPGLGRPESSRPKRVSEALKNELSLLLLRDASDPRLTGVTITRVVVTPDLKQAKVYFSLQTGGASCPATAAMRRARGFFRSHLAKVLNMRYTPDLLFFFDHQNEEAQRIDDLFRQIEKERKDEPS